MYTTNLWEAMEAVLREKFIALSAYMKKGEKFHTSDLTAHLKVLEQKEADSPSESKRQEIIKLRVEINRNKKIQRIKETKSWFFEKINKIDKHLSKLIKRQRQNI